MKAEIVADLRTERTPVIQTGGFLRRRGKDDDDDKKQLSV